MVNILHGFFTVESTIPGLSQLLFSLSSEFNSWKSQRKLRKQTQTKPRKKKKKKKYIYIYIYIYIGWTENLIFECVGLPLFLI